MRRPAAAVILIISLFMAVPAIAGVWEDAGKAYNQGDYKTAYRLIKPLAEQGSSKAQNNLGIMYDKGQGVPQDYAEAAKWLRKAADQGFPPAQVFLGYMYSSGQGVPQDDVLAHMWLNLGIPGFPPGIDTKLPTVTINEVASRMTDAQIIEAQKLAREWKPKKEK